MPTNSARPWPHSRLRRFPTPAIRDELALGDSQWVFFSSALQRKADARGLADIATTSERLLEVTDRLTGLYDAALKQVLG